MTRPRRIAGLALAATLLSTAVISTVATSATAHTPAASATCSTLTVSLTNYSTSRTDSEPNTVVVWVDGDDVATEHFGTTFTADYPLGEAIDEHIWTVEIDAVGTGYDRTFTGETAPCVESVPRDAAASVSTTLPSCTEPAELVLERLENATWSTPTLTTGPGAYSVTATATSGHQFDDETTERVFTGELLGAIDATDPECVSSVDPVVVPPQPEPTSVSTLTVADDCESGTQTMTMTLTVNDWVLDTVLNEWVATEPVVTVSTTTQAIDPELCPAVGPTDGTPPTTGTDGGTPDPTLLNPMVGSVFAIEGGALAHSGTDSGLPIAIGLALLLGGLALLLVRMRTRVQSQ